MKKFPLAVTMKKNSPAVTMKKNSPAITLKKIFPAVTMKKNSPAMPLKKKFLAAPLKKVLFLGLLAGNNRLFSISPKFYQLKKLLFLALLAGCSMQTAQSTYTAQSPTGEGLNRADPVYIQWLEKQSLNREAPALTSIVSGTALGWRAPSVIPPKNVLLDKASVWFQLNPWETVTTGSGSVLQELSQNGFAEYLKKSGFQGLYISPSAQNGTGWNLQEFRRDDIVSYKLAEQVGTEEEYSVWEQSMLLGGDMLSPALGVGPDFLLALRGIRDYPSLFMMTELPKELYAAIPAPSSRNPVDLTPSQKQTLIAQNILPPAFSRDHISYLKPSGFAVTPEILGFDGTKRRWIYRYEGDINRPLLNVEDPSQTPARLLAASIIKQAGMLHQPLVGMSIAPLWGQDPSMTGEFLTADPAASALHTWNRSLHRYGAWSFLREAFPPAMINVWQKEGTDFVPDSMFLSGIEASLLSGNAGSLINAYEKGFMQQVDFSGLLHANSDFFQGSNYLLASRKQSLSLFAPTHAAYAPNIADNVSAAGLAALVIRAPYDDIVKISHRVRQNLPFSPEESKLSSTLEKIRDIHFLTIALPALMPGMLMITGHDIAGTVLAPEYLQAEARQSESLQGSSSEITPSSRAWIPVEGATSSLQIATKQGLPVGLSLYPPINRQLADPQSISSKITLLANIRSQTSLPTGTALGFAQTDSRIFALVTRLPNGSFFMVAANCSPNTVSSSALLPPQCPHLLKAQDLLTKQNLPVSARSVQLTLSPWQVRAIQF